MSIDPDVPTSVDLFGKITTDLQEGIVVGDDAITGTLKYVTGYTGFSGDPDLQSGNYLTFKVGCPSDAVATVEVVGGFSGPVTLDSDRIIVLRIANNTQKIKVTVTKSGQTDTKTYSLDNLTLKTS